MKKNGGGRLKAPAAAVNIPKIRQKGHGISMPRLRSREVRIT